MSIAFPSSPTTGATYSVGGRTWRWTGSRWERYDLAGAVVSATAPANPVPGMRWIHEDHGRAYEYLDGTWVELSGAGGPPDNPARAMVFSFIF